MKTKLISFFKKRIIPTFLFSFTITILEISCTVYNENAYFRFAKEKIPVTVVEFAKIKSFHFIKPEKFIGRGIIENQDSSLTLYGNIFGTNHFLFINSETGNYLEDSVNDKLSEIMQFDYLSRDSIFVFFDPGERIDSRHDSTIVRINVRGEIMDIYTFADARVYSSMHPENFKNDQAVFWSPNFYGTSVNKNSIIVHFESQSSVLGDFMYQKTPILGQLNLKTKKFEHLPIKYPNIIYDTTYYNASDKLFITNIAHDGDFISGFKYTPLLIKFNPLIGKQKNILLKSTIIDTIFPSKTSVSVPKGYDNDMPYPKYFTLYYDKYRKLYFRFVMYPKTFGSGKNIYSVIIADTSFNVVGETILPNIHTSRFFFTKNFILIPETNDKKGTISYAAYKLKYRTGTNQELILRLKTGANSDRHVKLSDYVKNFGKINTKNYTATFICFEQMCEGTFDYYMQHFKLNNKHYRENNVFLFIQTFNPEIVRKILDTQYNLPPAQNKNIIIDSTTTYLSYTNFATQDLARNIVVRNGKIKQDTTFALDEKSIIDFQNFLIHSGKEQEKLKK